MWGHPKFKTSPKSAAAFYVNIIGDNRLFAIKIRSIMNKSTSRWVRKIMHHKECLPPHAVAQGLVHIPQSNLSEHKNSPNSQDPNKSYFYYPAVLFLGRKYKKKKKDKTKHTYSFPYINLHPISWGSNISNCCDQSTIWKQFSLDSIRKYKRRFLWNLIVHASNSLLRTWGRPHKICVSLYTFGHIKLLVIPKT